MLRFEVLKPRFETVENVCVTRENYRGPHDDLESSLSYRLRLGDSLVSWRRREVLDPLQTFLFITLHTYRREVMFNIKIYALTRVRSGFPFSFSESKRTEEENDVIDDRELRSYDIV